ncbi:tripartite tricarboxylate transporter TctB family protein [Microbacterium lacusdiani]
MSTEVIRTPEGEPASRWSRINVSDLVITLVLLIVFAGAFAMATAWKPLAAYFPLGVSVAGMVATATFLVRVVFFPRKPDAPKANVPEAAKSMSEQEYEFFKSLTARDWLTSIGWLGGFFVALSILGIYIAIGGFTLAYLRLQASKSWRFAVAYTVALVGVIYLAFELVLKLPLPGGAFGLA